MKFGKLSDQIVNMVCCAYLVKPYFYIASYLIKQSRQQKLAIVFLWLITFFFSFLSDMINYLWFCVSAPKLFNIDISSTRAPF